MDKTVAERLTYLAVAALALAAGYFFHTSPQPQPPAVTQPFVQPAPAPAPCPGPFCPRPRCPGPSCPGDCIEHAIPASKPFNVVCPYCRNTLTVQPSVRPTGDLVEEEAKTPPPK